MTESNANRRQFLQQSAALTILSQVPGTVNAESPSESDQNPLFQPEEFWRDRIEPPDDGKRLGWFIDTRRCFGCHACEVSCKAENDIPLGNFIRQTFYQDVGEFPKVARLFVPMSCQHCEDTPCIKACPCGALHKKSGGTVAVDYETCCGHGTCVEVCPYGAIYLDPVAKQAVKCHNCYHREAGEESHSMEPACVPTCPSQAIYFGDLNDKDSKISHEIAAAEAAGELSQLRPEKKTKPRMWFRGKAIQQVESRIPGEGESYSPGSYDIYNWKSDLPIDR
jgi:Fe-S-cluster-containing dehydrogenase component